MLLNLENLTKKLYVYINLTYKKSLQTMFYKKSNCSIQIIKYILNFVQNIFLIFNSKNILRSLIDKIFGSLFIY